MKSVHDMSIFAYVLLHKTTCPVANVSTCPVSLVLVLICDRFFDRGQVFVGGISTFLS